MTIKHTIADDLFLQQRDFDFLFYDDFKWKTYNGAVVKISFLVTVQENLNSRWYNLITKFTVQGLNCNDVSTNRF